MLFLLTALLYCFNDSLKMQQVISAQLVAQNGNDFLETSLERSLNKFPFCRYSIKQVVLLQNNTIG